MSNLLRQATRDDIEAIWNVRYSVRENRLPHGLVSSEDVRRQIEDTGKGWVVESDGKIVAFAIGNSTTGNIWGLFVHPSAEGHGHGTRLHDAVTQWLWSQGHKTLWLTTGATTRARKFYELNGWRDVGLTDKGEARYELSRP